jgi:hypothetical protein
MTRRRPVVTDSTEYAVVWTPHRDAPSLLGPESRPSCLSELCRDDRRSLKNAGLRIERHRHEALYARAKRDLAEMGR